MSNVEGLPQWPLLDSFALAHHHEMETITPYVYLHKHSKAYSSSNHLDNSEQWENAVILQ